MGAGGANANKDAILGSVDNPCGDPHSARDDRSSPTDAPMSGSTLRAQPDLRIGQGRRHRPVGQVAAQPLPDDPPSRFRLLAPAHGAPSGLGWCVAVLDGIHRSLHAAGQTQFLEDALDVDLDGAFGYVQFAGDFLVAQSLGEKGEYAALTR